MSARPRYFSMQAGRGIAALLVVVQHCAYMLGGSGNPTWQDGRWFYYLEGTKLGVEFFFVLSGMVMLVAHWRDLGEPWALPSYFWKRFRRIYPTYWLVFLPWFLLRLRGGLTGANGGLSLTLLSNLWLVHLASVPIVLVPAWTLFHEVMFYLVFSLLLLHRRFGSLALGLWFAGSFLAAVHPGWHNAFFFSPLHLLFGLGMLTAWLQRRGSVAGRLPFYAGCIVFAVCVAFSRFILQVDLIAGVAAAMVLLGGMEMERRGILRVPRWLIFLGDASYALYLAHYPVLVIFSRLLFRLSHSVPVPLWLAFVLMLAVSTAIGCAAHHFIERPLLRWTGSLFQTAPAGGTL